MDADDEPTPATTHRGGAPCPLNSHPHHRFVCRCCRRPVQQVEVRQEQEADSQSHEAAERRAALRSRKAIGGSRKTVVAETSQSSAEIHGSKGEEGPTIRSTAKSRKKAKKKERSRRKAAAEATPSQSSVEIHMPSEEEASTMAEVDTSLHEKEEEEEELPDWMSQLFEKLDSEVNDDSICPNQKVAQVVTHPILEGGIPSEIHRSSKGTDSTMANVDIGGLHEEDQLSDWMSQLFEKLDLEANKDDDSTGKVAQGETHSLLEGSISSDIHRSSKEKDSAMFEKMELQANKDGILSTGKVAHGETHTLLEGGVSSEIHGSSKEKDSTMVKLYFGGLYDDDKFLDWMMEICSPPEVDQEEKYPIHDDVPDEFNDLVDEANGYCKSTKKDCYRKTIENGIKWMSEECFLAFTKSVENFHSEGIEHRFGELCSQCFNVEAHDKNFHHFNFTIEEKHGSSDVWTSKLYFAEVKQLSGLKSYLCCLLEPNECGHCYGCKNQDMYDLKHPSRGGYEEGDADICWPFVDDPEYDSSSGDDYNHNY